MPRRLTLVNLPAMDNWGPQPFSPEGHRDMLEIIQYRNNRKSTVIASQLPIKEWHRVIGEGTIADAIFYRIAHCAHHIELTSESQQREKKNRR